VSVSEWASCVVYLLVFIRSLAWERNKEQSLEVLDVFFQFSKRRAVTCLILSVPRRVACNMRLLNMPVLFQNDTVPPGASLCASSALAMFYPGLLRSLEETSFPVKESERFELALYRRIELLEYGIPPEFLARRETRESDRELGSRGHCIDDLSSQTDTKRMDEHWGEQQSG
jgi:hypothetical protein